MFQAVYSGLEKPLRGIIVQGSDNVVKTAERENKAICFFNLGTETETYSLDITGLGISGKFTLRDLWRQQNIPSEKRRIKLAVPSHGVQLLKICR